MKSGQSTLSHSALILSVEGQPASDVDRFKTAWADDLTHVPLVFRADRPNTRWATQIDDAVRGIAGPILIVAHDAAGIAFAHWAQLSPKSYTAAIAGAVFHLPSSIIASPPPGVPASSPRIRLPFPSFLISDSGPRIDAVLAQADIWGSRFVDSAASQSIYRGDLRGGVSPAESNLIALLRGGEASPDQLPPHSTHPESRSTLCE